MLGTPPGAGDKTEHQTCTTAPDVIKRIRGAAFGSYRGHCVIHSTSREAFSILQYLSGIFLYNDINYENNSQKGNTEFQNKEVEVMIEK